MDLNDFGQDSVGCLLSYLHDQIVYPNSDILSWLPPKDQTWDSMLGVQKI